jgi:hypothetical protein
MMGFKTASYVYYSLAATLFLDNHPAEAEAYVNKARELRSAHQAEIRSLVDFDLKRLAEERTELEKQANTFRQQLLKIAG